MEMWARIMGGLFLVLLLGSTVFADILYVQDSLRNPDFGDGPKTYNLGENSYTLENVYCDFSPWVRIRINGGSFVNFNVGNTYDLDSNFYIKMDAIDPERCDNHRFCSGVEWYCLAEFSIYARNAVCGDGRCEENENCRSDNCCGGITVYLSQDKDNCGACDNRCQEDERCIAGQCLPDCGNGYCEPGEQGICALDCSWCGDNTCNATENYETCAEDCERAVICGDNFCSENERCCTDCGGCEEGQECIYDRCITRRTQIQEEQNILAGNDSEEPAEENSQPNAEVKPKTVIIERNKDIIEKIIDWFKNLFS